MTDPLAALRQLVSDIDSRGWPHHEAGARALRLLADEATVERLARLLEPDRWRVFDSYLADAKRNYKSENAGYDPEAFKDRQSMDLARAVIAHLAAQIAKET